MFPLKVSAIVLTYNEEKNLEACLASIKNYVDEIIIDSGFKSEDISLTSYGSSRIEQQVYSKIKPFEAHFSRTDLFVEAIK